MADHRVPLRISLLRYDHAAPVTSGEVEIAGVRPDVVLTAAPPTAETILDEGADVVDLSLTEFLRLRAEGEDRVVALPVFLSRSFRHRSIVVRDGASGVSDALEGARVGVVDRSAPAVVNAVGALSDQLGVEPASLDWITASDASALTDLLARGTVDVVIDAQARRIASLVEGARPLFADPAAAELTYFEKTGVLPIERLLVLRAELTRTHRWLASNLYRSFEIARRRYFARLSDIRASRVPIPGAPHHYRRLQGVFGSDFWAYGVPANIASLEAARRYAGDQGLPLDDSDPAQWFASFEPFVDGI